MQIMEANAVTRPISGVAQEYRHLVKGPEKMFWNDHLQMNLGNYPRVSELWNEQIQLSSFQKQKYQIWKKVTYVKIVCKLKPEK